MYSSTADCGVNVAPRSYTPRERGISSSIERRRSPSTASSAAPPPTLDPRSPARSAKLTGSRSTASQRRTSSSTLARRWT